MTQLGKQRTRGNAVKHGIFSSVVFVEGEPKAELDSLRNALRRDREPKGALEELLVDDLAALFWRLRRPIIAEGSKIRRMRSTDADLEQRQDDQLVYCNS